MKFSQKHTFYAFILFLLNQHSLQKLEKGIVLEKKKFSSSHQLIEKAKRSIVLIRSRVEVPFITDSDETKQSTGFIINKEKGIIITSKNTARISPTFIKIQFYDGSIFNGKVIYSDPFLPFGVIQVEVKNNNLKNYDYLPLGNTINPSKFYPSSNVILICLAEDENYVIKRGKIVNTNRNYRKKYGSLFQTNIDRVKGLFGCPILNESGEIIGLHYYATLTTSYELRIDYINNVLPQILNNTKVHRGDIGITINLMIFGIAKINYKLNEKITDEIAKELKTTGGPPEIMVISSVNPYSSSYSKLKGGDILYKVNDKIVGNDFFLLEQILNSNVGKNISVVVSRNSQIISLEILVEDSEKEKVNRYIAFSGAYFHEINNIVRSYLYTNLKGVYLTYTKSGSPFNKVSVQSNNKNNYILTSINSNKIDNLNQFISYFKNNCDSESIYVEGLDFNVFSGSLSAEPVDLDFSSSLLEEYILNLNSGKFVSKSIDLKEFCNKKPKNNSNYISQTNRNQTVHSLNNTLESENYKFKKNSPRTLLFDSLNKTNKTLNTSLVRNTNLKQENINSKQSSIKPLDLRTVTNNKIIRNTASFPINYNKSFFFKQESLLNDRKIKKNTYKITKNSKNIMKNTMSNKIIFIEDKSLKTQLVRKKFERQFLDHLSGMHLIHIN